MLDRRRRFFRRRTHRMPYKVIVGAAFLALVGVFVLVFMRFFLPACRV